MLALSERRETLSARPRWSRGSQLSGWRSAGAHICPLVAWPRVSVCGVETGADEAAPPAAWGRSSGPRGWATAGTSVSPRPREASRAQALSSLQP